MAQRIDSLLPNRQTPVFMAVVTLGEQPGQIVVSVGYDERILNLKPGSWRKDLIDASERIATFVRDEMERVMQ